MKCRVYEGKAPLKGGETRDAQVLGTIVFPGAARLKVDEGGKEMRVEGKCITVEPVQTKDEDKVVIDAIYDLEDEQIAHCSRTESPYRVALVKEDKKAKKEKDVK